MSAVLTVGYGPAVSDDRTLWTQQAAVYGKLRVKAAAAMTEANSTLGQILSEGREAGVPVSAMAAAAGISRDTAHRLLREYEAWREEHGE